MTVLVTMRTFASYSSFPLDKWEHETLIDTALAFWFIIILDMKQVIVFHGYGETPESFWLTEVVKGDIVLDKKESSEYGWFNLEEALNLWLYPATKNFFGLVKKGQIEV